MSKCDIFSEMRFIWYKYVLISILIYILIKGAGLFQKARRTKEQAAGRGTSRYPNGIKSWPEPIGNWILMKIIFLRHKISHLWWKIAIVWAILGHFWHVFADFFVSVTQLCSLWEPFQPGHSWPMWGHGLKPFQTHWAINPWLESVKNGSFYCQNRPWWQAGSRAGKSTWKLSGGPYYIPIHGKTLLRAI